MSDTLLKINYIDFPQIDPVSLYSLIRQKYSNSVLLESMEGPEKLATQSVICFSPKNLYKVEKGKLYEGNRQLSSDFNQTVKYLKRIIRDNQVGGIHSSNQFRGGLVGFTSYDFVKNIEPKLKIQWDKDFPEAVYALYLDGIVFDHKESTIRYFYVDGVSERFSEIIQVLGEPVDSDELQVLSSKESMTKLEFEKAVRLIKQSIKAGETFQTVLSHSIRFEIKGDPFLIYKRLRTINPSPYMYCLELDSFTIIGSSPELLVEVKGNEISTYPIAGTRPKGKSIDDLNFFKSDLMQDEKELAEHNMLVDLGRNDIGKVSKFGSVKVPLYLSVEEFSHVIHIVSKVTGELREDFDQFDAFFALFPAGTVSGAPKIRSMELISKLEGVPRGPYAGSVGFFGLNGNCVQAISIRTIFGKENNFRAQAGAGVVLDSDPIKEYYETKNKMAAILEATGKVIST